MIRRLLAGVLAAALCTGLAACTDSKPAAEPTSQPSLSTATLSVAEARLVDVYVTLLRSHLATEERERRPVYINVEPAGGSGALSEAVRQRITADAGVSMDVRWVTSRKSVTKPNSMIRDGGYYAELPSVPRDRIRFRLHMFTLCGGLCGYGDRYLLTERAEGWHARAVGPMVIS